MAHNHIRVDTMSLGSSCWRSHRRRRRRQRVVFVDVHLHMFQITSSVESKTERRDRTYIRCVTHNFFLFSHFSFIYSTIRLLLLVYSSSSSASSSSVYDHQPASQPVSQSIHPSTKQFRRRTLPQLYSVAFCNVFFLLAFIKCSRHIIWGHFSEYTG